MADSKFSLRSLFQSKPDPSRNTTPKGASGRAHFNGLVELDEMNVELAGQRGRIKFDEMYWSDPDIRRLVLMVWSPIMAATYGVQPYGGDDASPQDIEAQEIVEFCLLQVMRPNLTGHLAEAGPLLLRQGFVPFEQIWTAVDWNGKLIQSPRKLDLRLPRTIWKWYQDDYGDLEKVIQILPNAHMAELDASSLTYYRIQAEGDNWEGRSLLRQAYKSWFLKDRLERIDAIGQERKAVGVPVVYPPANTDDETRGEVENVLAAMHTSESAYLIMPGPHVSAYNDSNGEGWLVDIVKYDSSSGSGIQESIKLHKEGITSSFLGDFMQLGHHQVGARATAQVQEDPFLTAVRAMSQAVLDEINRSLVRRIVDLNCPDVEGYPELTMTLEDESSLTELSSFLEQTVKAGVVNPDPELEDYIRERADLPPADPDKRAEREASEKAGREAAMQGLQEGESPDEEGEPPKANGKQEGKPAGGKPGGNAPGKPKGKPKTLAKGDPAWYEQLLSQGDIKQALEDAKDRFEQAGTAPLADFTASVVGRAKTGRPAPDDPPQALVEALEGELDRLYQVGHSTVSRELSDQHARLGTGQVVTMASLTDLGAALTVRRRQQRKAAQVAARNVTREVAGKVENAGLNPNVTDAGLLAAGSTAARAALRSQAQQVAAGALNAGRADAATANAKAIAGAYYTSCLDSGTCDECQTADSGELIPVDSPEYESLSPPNPNCYGGPRCRCMWVYVLADDPAALG